MQSHTAPSAAATPAAPATPQSDAPPRRFIARQLALGFGAVSVVSLFMCAMLLTTIFNVSGLVASMRHDETSIRQGLELATAVRELSIHIARALIEGDEAQLTDYRAYRRQVRTRMQQLALRIPKREGFRIQRLQESTQRMHALLMESALPASRRGNVQAVRRAHRQIEALAKKAATQADALAQATTSKMAHAHVLATQSTRLGLIAGGACALAVVLLSIASTMRLRAAVLKPLLTLTEAATQFGQGDFGLRVGRVGRGELAALGNAFDLMADELARREARLLQNERMAAIGQLAAGIAHELHNPIGIIRGYLKTMTPEEDTQTLREELAILDEEASYCQRITEDLLSYARAEELSIDTIEAQDFLRETARRFQAGANTPHIAVAAEAATLEGDGARLRQVLLNLLKNASAVASVVKLHGSTVQAHYHLDVMDNGPGIPPEDRHRIFEPFFSKRRGGTGLGLAVCEGIVKAHGGSIAVSDAPGGGAIFSVRIPLRHAAAASKNKEGLL